MSKYYYDDPIIAAYMAKEFGVNFDNLIKGNELVCLAWKIIDEDKMNSVMDKKFFVAPESEAIFAPKENDKGVYFKDNKMLFANFFIDRKIGCWIECKDGAFWVDQQVLIIMRDNKSFFMPKTSAETIEKE